MYAFKKESQVNVWQSVISFITATLVLFTVLLEFLESLK